MDIRPKKLIHSCKRLNYCNKFVGSTTYSGRPHNYHITPAHHRIVPRHRSHLAAPSKIQSDCKETSHQDEQLP